MVAGRGGGEELVLKQHDIDGGGEGGGRNENGVNIGGKRRKGLSAQTPEGNKTVVHGDGQHPFSWCDQYFILNQPRK
jgi:hypothetical protein